MIIKEGMATHGYTETKLLLLKAYLKTGKGGLKTDTYDTMRDY